MGAGLVIVAVNSVFSTGRAVGMVAGTAVVVQATVSKIKSSGNKARCHGPNRFERWNRVLMGHNYDGLQR